MLHSMKRWAKVTSKILAVSLPLTALALAVVVLSSPEVRAQEDSAPLGKPAESETVQLGLPESFDYTAERSNNLTLLVRRALQIYDENDDSLSLSEAQVIYAETNVVHELGAYQLDVGQEVSVPTDLVAKYAASSQELSEGRLAAWNRYARRARFDLSGIQPANVSQEKAGGDQPAANQPTSQEDGTKADNGKASDGVDWWWLALLAAVILGLWYLMRQREEEAPAAPTKRRTTTRTRRTRK
jgi:hypothetical protein